VAESQIRDADVAQEASLLTKNKILQQAGSSILAHANHEPEIALKLLIGV
ncbi:MAG: flagellin FliC, partial [Oligoflexia bacterium]|nr:flagellin FliC [Oligoflexia bacterium]